MFVVLMLGAIAKAPDLILDSSQQAAFQKVFDKVTEWLIDINIVKWYPKLRDCQFSIPIFALILGIEALFLYALMHAKTTATLPPGQLHLGWSGYVTLASWQFLFYIPIVKALSRAKRPWRFCLLTLLPGILGIVFLAFSVLAFVGWVAFGETIKQSDPSLGGVTGRFVVATLWPVLLLFAVAFECFLLTTILFVLGLLVSCVHFCVFILRHLMWRMATHVKGAWAAVWILITAVVAIIDVVAHNR